ncbi:MAG: hypothetical protein ACE5HV_15520 [Acidobacteriota bacterium]
MQVHESERSSSSDPLPEQMTLESSDANGREYLSFRSHFRPRSRAGWSVVLAFLALLLLAEWPVLPLANRIEPTMFGLPFLFTYLLLVYLAMIGLLIIAALRKL